MRFKMKKWRRCLAMLLVCCLTGGLCQTANGAGKGKKEDEEDIRLTVSIDGEKLLEQTAKTLGKDKKFRKKLSFLLPLLEDEVLENDLLEEDGEESVQEEEEYTFTDSLEYKILFDRTFGQVYEIENLKKAGIRTNLPSKTKLRVFVKKEKESQEAEESYVLATASDAELSTSSNADQAVLLKATASDAGKASASNSEKATSSDAYENTYRLSGEEKLIFLFINRSGKTMFAQLNIDGKRSGELELRNGAAILEDSSCAVEAYSLQDLKEAMEEDDWYEDSDASGMLDLGEDIETRVYPEVLMDTRGRISAGALTVRTSDLASVNTIRLTVEEAGKEDNEESEGSYEFEVTYTSGEEEQPDWSSSQRITASAGETAELYHFTSFQYDTCWIREVDAPEGAEIRWEGEGVSDMSDGICRIHLDDGEDAEITCINAYNGRYLSIENVISQETEEELAVRYEVRLQGVDPEKLEMDGAALEDVVLEEDGSDGAVLTNLYLQDGQTFTVSGFDSEASVQVEKEETLYRRLREGEYEKAEDFCITEQEEFRQEEGKEILLGFETHAERYRILTLASQMEGLDQPQEQTSHSFELWRKDQDRGVFEKFEDFSFVGAKDSLDLGKNDSAVLKIDPIYKQDEFYVVQQEEPDPVDSIQWIVDGSAVEEPEALEAEASTQEDGKSGRFTLENYETHVLCTNIYTDRTLTVTKKALEEEDEESTEELTGEFSFHVDFWDAEGDSLAAVPYAVTDAQGNEKRRGIFTDEEESILLRPGESAVFWNLPAGTSYQVEEAGESPQLFEVNSGEEWSRQEAVFDEVHLWKTDDQGKETEVNLKSGGTSRASGSFQNDTADRKQRVEYASRLAIIWGTLEIKAVLAEGAPEQGTGDKVVFSYELEDEDGRKFYSSVEFSDGKTENSSLIEVPAGTYRITPLSALQYETGEAVTVQVTRRKTALAEFENRKMETGYFTGSSTVINRITGQ